MTMNDRRFNIEGYVEDFGRVVDAYGLGWSYSQLRVYSCGAAVANPPAGPRGI